MKAMVATTTTVTDRTMTVILLLLIPEGVDSQRGQEEEETENLFSYCWETGERRSTGNPT